MNIFYNTKGVGDVLLVQLVTHTFEEVITETTGDITLIKDAETGKVGAFNVFNSSKYLQLTEQGSVEVTKEIVESLQQLLINHDFDLKLEVDFSPKFVVGYVSSKEKHPNADKLNVCQVEVGEETLQIVCGAPNVEAGQKVVVAKVGAVMPSGLMIKDAELRGVASSGMICSAKELALPDAPTEKGILVLEDTAEIGSAFQA
ncbi:YtpR family tRNA-binding protein [Paenisporosarcina sp. FSL H8-0542]|uniref:YtpR family tRNA-binding protein n=1 Tax=Paenisporosarcina sp. FSL H8-0542 TaxID=2921401 RepID=UPI00315AE671